MSGYAWLCLGGVFTMVRPLHQPDQPGRNTPRRRIASYALARVSHLPLTVRLLPVLVALGALLIPAVASLTGLTARLSGSVAQAAGISASSPSPAPLLPGEARWNGSPSYLFGTNDAYDWAGSAGFDSQPGIQAQVKAAHIPLIRAWFPQYPNFGSSGTQFTDAHQLAIAQAVKNSGAACMANLPQPNSVAYDLHLVSLLAPYCHYFEVMNEPDYSGMNPVSVANYLSFWNTFVPQARALQPNASFGGPALATEFGLSSSTYMQQVLQGMQASGVVPDFVTFHWYMCGAVAQSACLGDVAQWAPTEGKSIAGWLSSYFPGHHVALGITEWNQSPAPGGAMNSDAFMSQFMKAALAGLEANPYLSFATQYDLASYACYGSCDLFNTLGGIGSAPTGAARPEFTVLANEIAREQNGGVSSPPPAPTGASTQPPAPTTTTTTTTQPTTSGVPAYAHVITIMEENHSYSDVIGSSNAPYINGTLLPSGALATNFTSEVASSLPNYLALVGGSTLGLTNNCQPGPGCQSSGASIASNALAAGKTWRAYEENMTANCQNVVDGGTGGLYTIHHNPFPFYTGLASSCATNDVPYTKLASDLQSPASLPAYVFISPSLNDDMHNGTVQQGDTWLSQQIPAIQSSPACKQSRCLIAITWDEGTYVNGVAGSQRIATILLGPGVQPGARDATAYNHYSLLHTTEVALGLPTMTSNDAGAALMTGMFTSSGGTPTSTPTSTPSPTASPTTPPTTSGTTSRTPSGTPADSPPSPPTSGS